jgi:hypothetical protein
VANKQQSAIGGTVEVPANDSATVAHESDGGEFISLVEYVADTPDAVDAQFLVRQPNANTINLVTDPDDGQDSTKSGDATVDVPAGEGARFLAFVELDAGDSFEVRLTNTTGGAVDVTFFASAAQTRDVALGR